MSNTEAMEIQITIEEAREAVKNRDTAIKLLKSAAFKKIIGKMYYEEESIRLVGLMGEPRLTDASKENVKNMMYGVAYLRSFIGDIIQKGNQMEMELEEASAELDAMEG